MSKKDQDDTEHVSASDHVPRPMCGAYTASVERTIHDAMVYGARAGEVRAGTYDALEALRKALSPHGRGLGRRR